MCSDMLFKILLLVFVSYSHCFLDEQTALETKYVALEARVKHLEAVNSKCPCVDAVGFNVHLTHDISPFGSYQHIIFDHIISNIGDCYDINSGHFTAPYHGIYAFVVSFTKMPHHNLSVMIVKNGQDLTQGLTMTNGDFGTATVAATVELMKGDRVWAENAYPVDNTEELHGQWTFFSGHLVKSMPT